ncbi:MAG: ABC transporter ATP-binding protein [Bdellovibrionaceae bacterium]|nr:ABC transporter ATP-binding protein [Pseudobdellovibrionaceae bacterium]
MAMISVRNFAKSFDDKVVHRDINFDVQPGECLGLLGGSGAGKSVILRSLIGLVKPDSGQILIDGEDITKYDERELVEIRKKVAYVFQGGALFDSLTVYDNLAYTLREHTDMTEDEMSERIHTVLAEFGLEGNDLVYPADLSGGMQKRVGLARSIIMRPEVILYDEPTAGLDPYNTKRIQEMILTLKGRGKTSVFVTHDMPSALAVCDKLALVIKGEISCIESVDKYQTDPECMIKDFIEGRFA